MPKPVETTPGLSSEALESNDSKHLLIKSCERIAPYSPESATIEAIKRASEKLLQADIKLSNEEKKKIFLEAIEYFGTADNLVYPIAHATGSDALRMIIDEGKMKSGGTGEHGEATHFSAGEFQDGVSVAEMHHYMADTVEVLYARLGSSKKVAEAVLKINADDIDGLSILDDYLNEYVKYGPTQQVLEAIALKTNQDVADLKKKIALEYEGITDEELTPKMIAESKIIMDVLRSSIERSAERIHYKTAEGEKRDYYAFLSVISSCEAGVFPAVIYSEETYSDPESILNIREKIKDPQNIQEKILKELQQQYQFLKDHNPDYNFAELRGNLDLRKKYLLEVKQWIMRDGGPYSRLLHPKASDNPEELQRKKTRLDELSSQYPCIIIMEGQDFKDSGLTYSQQKGERPVKYFPVEDRIMSDISVGHIKQIVVPEAKIGEVRRWLGKSATDIKLIPFEYFEVERLIKHQTK